MDLDEAERLAAATSTGKSSDDRPTKNYDRESKVIAPSAHIVFSC